MRSQGVLRTCILAGISVAVFSGGAHAKTAKECEAEYQANKTEIQARKELKKDFIAKCRAEEESAAPASPAPATPLPPRQTANTTATPPPATGVAGKAQYATEAEARGHCPTDTVVWANLHSHIFHFSGHPDYGKTKRGAYMCEKDTASAGFRAAKSEKQP
jgi:hypothetical protein